MPKTFKPTMKIRSFIACSLDGFIARPDGALDWLENPAFTIAEEDFGYAQFMAGTSCLVMGRNTFEKVLTFGEWPYEGTRVIVLSQSLKALPETHRDKAELSAESPLTLTERLQREGEDSLYIDGGRLIQSFLRTGLLHELIVTRIPLLLGRGIPLFGELNGDTLLTLLANKSYANGFVQSHYRIG